MDGQATHDYGDPDLTAVVARELSLLDPAVRRSREEVLAFLHPDFVEFSATGRRWDAAGVAESLATEGIRPFEAREVVPARLADDVILLTYELHEPGSASLRSSIWVRAGGEWLLRFHQGSPAAETE